MRSFLEGSDVWLAGLVPLLAYLLLAVVSEAYYVACCGGIPDAGRVPVQLLPDFLISYRPSSLSLWVVSSSMFAVPGFAAGWFSRRAAGALMSLVALLSILLHASRVIWQWQDSYSRFAEEVINIEYVPWKVAIGSVVATLVAAVLTVIGVTLGRRTRLKRSA